MSAATAGAVSGIKPAETETRPYHHGDLRRALVDAALHIVEREGLSALSLRAVAREAGVSPAAPYHHFKDKQELLLAVGAMGFERLTTAMQAAKESAPDPKSALTALGVAYVCFARRHPALYTLMWDCTRHVAGTPEPDEEKRAYKLLEETIIEAGVASPEDPVRLKLAAVAAWTSAHGLAEMASFEQFEEMKAAMGEEAFYGAVISFHGDAGC